MGGGGGRERNAYYIKLIIVDAFVCFCLTELDSPEIFMNELFLHYLGHWSPILTTNFKR